VFVLGAAKVPHGAFAQATTTLAPQLCSRKLLLNISQKFAIWLSATLRRAAASLR
jgi:hypothetical protein